MPIVIQCASCSSTYKVDDALAGKKVKCRKCSSIISVPDPNALEPEPVLEPEPSLVEDSPASGPAIAARTCPSCGAVARPSAVMCLICGYNFRTGKGEGAPSVELAGDAPVEKKRSRFLRAPGKRIFTSIDSMIFMIMFWVFLVSLVVWGISVSRLAGAFSFSVITPTLVVVGLMLLVVVPAMALAIKATCNTMQYPPRHDNYIRAATVLAFPLAVSLICSGGAADNPLYGGLIGLSWFLTPVLFGYLFRADIVEWVGTMIAGGVALAIAWGVIVFGAPYLPTLTGPLYPEAMAQGPWMRIASANAHMPVAGAATPPPVAPTEVATVTPQTSTPAAPAPTVQTPVTPTVPSPRTVTITTVPLTPTPAVTPLTTGTPSTPVAIAQGEGLADISADPDLQGLRQIVVSDITSQYFLAVKDNGEGEATVERWSVDPVAKKGEMSFQELPKEANDYAISPTGSILVSLSRFPKNQLQVSNFDKAGTGRKIPLDHKEWLGKPRLVGFVDAGHFVVRWSGEGLLQLWGVDGTVASFIKSERPEAMGENLNLWAISPSTRLGTKLAMLHPGQNGNNDIVIDLVASWSMMNKFTPLTDSYQEAGLAFSPDTASIGLCALTPDGGTVLTFDCKSGVNKQTIIFPANIFPTKGSERRKIAHGLVWMGNNQLLLVGANTLYDCVTGKKIGSLGVDNVEDARSIGPNTILLVQEGSNGTKNALVAKVNSALANTARVDEKK